MGLFCEGGPYRIHAGPDILKITFVQLRTILISWYILTQLACLGSRKVTKASLRRCI